MRLVPTILLLVLLPATASIADGPEGVRIGHGDRLGSVLAPGETDSFTVALSEGDRITVAVKAKKIAVRLRLESPTGAPAELADHLKKDGTAKPSVKAFPVGRSGSWTIRLTSESETEGAYTVTVKLKHAKPASQRGIEVSPGTPARLHIAAAKGLLGVTLRRKSGPGLDAVRLLADDESEIAGPLAFTGRGKSIKAKKIPLDAPWGDYWLECTAAAGGSTVVDIKYGFKPAKRKGRKETLPPEARVAGVAPDHLKQGAVGAELTVSVDNLLDGSEVEIAGDGVEIRSREDPVPGQIRLTVDVDAFATLGPRSLTLRPPPDLGEPAAGSFAVHAPTPKITSLAGSPAHQADEAAGIVLDGENFRDGGLVDVDGGGVTAYDVVVESPARVRASLVVSSVAPTGPRTVTFTQPAAGGGESASLVDGLAVIYPVPEVEFLSRIFLAPGESVEGVTIYGDGFREGMDVTSEDGLTVTGARRVSDSEFEIDLAADGGADGARPLVLTQPPDRGGESLALSRAVRVTTGTAVPSPNTTKSLEFGSDVARSGDWLAVAAAGYGGTGAVFMFERDGDGWSLAQTIVPEYTNEARMFAASLDIEGTSLVVGAWGDDDATTNAGAVYHYALQSDGTWGFKTKFTPPEAGANSLFGRSLDLDGIWLVVGASGDGSTGAAWVFRKFQNHFEEVARLTATDPGTGDSFGLDVAVRDDTIIVGAPNADAGGTDRGAVYVFREEGGAWPPKARLVPGEPVDKTRFGTAVSIEGSVAAIGVPAQKTVYVFEETPGHVWLEKETLGAGEDVAAANFGESVAIRGDTIAVGDSGGGFGSVRPGLVHLFHRWGGQWLPQDVITRPDSENGDREGLRFHVDEDGIAIGAPRRDKGSITDVGRVLLFDFP